MDPDKMRQKREETYKRWNIPYTNDFPHFYQRILLAFASTFPGHKMPSIAQESFQMIRGNNDASAYYALYYATSVGKIACVLQELFQSLKSTGDVNCLYAFRELSEKVLNAINLSHVPIKMTQVNGEITLYPEGATEMDDALVNDTLTWLENYEEVRSDFTNALKIYMENQPEQYRQILDNLRLALEKLFRIILNNDKPLEKQKEPLCQWFDARGVKQEIVKMYTMLLDTFTLYQNEHVKHQGGVSQAEERFTREEVEFLIYLTGSFMRLFLSVQQSKPNAL